MSLNPEPLSAPLVGVQHFHQLAVAREAALGLAAKGLLYEIDAVGRGWVLLVEEPYAAVALAELELQTREQTPAISSRAEPLPPIQWELLLLPALVMIGFYHAQSWLGNAWTAHGIADAQAILRQGEWWRAITALTLHGDLSHLLANLMTGLLFAAFLQPQLGAGVAWLLILLSGALGNAINAWGYRGEPHLSLGASTAIFGALGLLIAADFAARWRSPATRNKWQLIVPLGAGFSLLAYLGVGEEHERVDFMAHGWGFLAGLALGLAWATVTRGRRLAGWLQMSAAGVSLGLIAGAWCLAVDR